MWKVLLMPALAGGMGWGIRGQYGHETGAMIAGVLVSLTLLLLFCPAWKSLAAAGAVAFMTIAIGFGGSETYGQTIGLTHDAPLVGNGAAFRWGLLGLAIKGGVWIGFAGAFLGMGLGGVRYRPLEMLGIFAGMFVLLGVGIWLFNEPFDPAHRILPKIYFSDDWRWEPDALLKPRRERWGGLLLALAGLAAYLAWVRRDRLAIRLVAWAAFGGAVGFPSGQCVQAFHAWNPEIFRDGFLGRTEGVINWWNMMETTFGAVFAAVLGFGLWLNRNLIREPALKPNAHSGRTQIAEAGSLLAYVALLVCWEFLNVPVLNIPAEPGIPMGLLPAVALTIGRWWPYAVALPLTIIPIAGKTVRQLCYKDPSIEPALGWIVYGVLPLAIATGMAIWILRRRADGPAGDAFLRPALLVNVWLYFALNFAFFRYPWPWQTWTSRTPNAMIYLFCAIGLTWLAVDRRRVCASSPGTKQTLACSG